MNPIQSQQFTRRSFLRSSAAISAATIAAMGTNYAFAQGSDRIRVGVVGLGGRGKGAAGNCVDSSANTTITAIGDLFPGTLRLLTPAVGTSVAHLRQEDLRPFICRRTPQRPITR